MGKEYSKQYYQENKYKWVEWAKNNRSRKNETSRKSALNCAVKRKQNNIDWVANNYETHLFTQSKNRARRAGLEFSITKEDIIIPEKCPYLGVTLTRLWGLGRVDSNASIDRIDSTKGYTADNIEVISFKANLLKRDASIRELQVFATNILRKFPCHS
jgi:hypothetical protein